MFLAVTAQGNVWDKGETLGLQGSVPEDSAIPVSQDAKAPPPENGPTARGPRLSNGVHGDVEDGSDYKGDLRRPTRIQVIICPIFLAFENPVVEVQEGVVQRQLLDWQVTGSQTFNVRINLAIHILERTCRHTTW